MGCCAKELKGDKVDSGGVDMGLHRFILAKPSQNEKAAPWDSNLQGLHWALCC